MKPPRSFELMEDDVRITSLVLAATVFFDTSMRAHAATLLEAWNAYRAWCPADALRWYSTESMSEHLRAGKATLGMLDAWLAPGAPERDIVSFEIKDGETFDATPHWLFDLVGIEGDLDEPSLVQIAVPWDDDPVTAQRLRAFTGALVSRLDASHAVAGCALLVSPYEEELAQTHAWARSMRHRGVDILLRENDRITVGRDSIKGVNWLTYVDQSRIERLGGGERLRAALDPGVRVTPIGAGLLLQAGDAPALGDENRQDKLPLYRSVFRALEPLTPAGFERSQELTLEDMDEAEALSQRWRRRLADQP